MPGTKPKAPAPQWYRDMAHRLWMWLYIDRYEFENPRWVRILRGVLIWFGVVSCLIGLAFWCMLFKLLLQAIWNAIF